MHNYYPSAPDKIQIKREMLLEYQLKIADLYNIPIGNVKKLVLNFFDKENYVITTLLETRIKTKKIHLILQFIQSQWLKPYIKFNTQKKNRS